MFVKRPRFYAHIAPRLYWTRPGPRWGFTGGGCFARAALLLAAVLLLSMR